MLATFAVSFRCAAANDLQARLALCVTFTALFALCLLQDNCRSRFAREHQTVDCNLPPTKNLLAQFVRDASFVVCSHFWRGFAMESKRACLAKPATFVRDLRTQKNPQRSEVSLNKRTAKN